MGLALWHSWVKLATKLSFHSGVLAQVPTYLLLIQFPDSESGKATGDGLRTWAPANHVADSNRIPGAWVNLLPTLATATI